MRKAKIHWRILMNATPGMIVFELNGDINCMIPTVNDAALRQKYFEVLNSSQNTNFKCTIVE